MSLSKTKRQNSIFNISVGKSLCNKFSFFSKGKLSQMKHGSVPLVVDDCHDCLRPAAEEQGPSASSLSTEGRPCCHATGTQQECVSLRQQNRPSLNDKNLCVQLHLHTLPLHVELVSLRRLPVVQIIQVWKCSVASTELL